MESYYDRDAPRTGVVRIGRFSGRRPAAPYVRVDRDGDAQMGGESSTGETSAAGAEPRRIVTGLVNRGRGGTHVSRSRSQSVAFPAGKVSVFDRLGDKVNRPPREIYVPGANRGGRSRANTFNKRASGPSWFRVKLVGAAQVSRPWLLQRLSEDISAQGRTLNPVQVGVEGNSLVFYVNDFHVSESLKQLHRVIQLPHGPKLNIGVTPSSPPVAHVDDTVKEKMKVALGRRFDVATHSLSVSAFNESPEFKSAGLSIQLSRSSHMNAVMDLIQANAQVLNGLDMSNNRIAHLIDLSEKLTKMPLRQLNLSDNLIKNIREVERLKDVPTLVDLDLSRNPIRDAYKDTPAYVEEVRKKLPNLQRLDGVELPRKIGFDAPARVALPIPTPYHVPSEEGKVQLMTFVEQYISYFDGQRATLTGAYAEDAQFSLLVERVTDKSNHFSSQNRNLQKADNTAKTQKLMVGSTAIVNYFLSLPRTNHILESFTLDVYFHENPLLGFAVSGCFREDSSSGSSKRGTLKSFNRNFVVRMAPEGLRIISDTWAITSPSVEQFNQYNQNSSELHFKPSPSGPPPTPSVSVEAQIDDVTKARMISMFATESGMNEHFSRMCLVDNDWDYAKAGGVFLQLRNENKLPAEAFVK